MELKRRLGLIDVFCIATGAMISSGIFVLPGLAYARAGPAVAMSYLLAGVLAATGLLCTAELATAMPKAGSDYFFIARGLGPIIGTVAGILNWVSFSLKSAFALVGIAVLIREFLAPIDMRLSGVLLGVILTGINLIGVKEAARFQVALVLGLITLMLMYVFYGLPAVNIHNYEPFTPMGMGAVFATAGFVFVSYGGLLKVASVAEEIQNPGYTLPVGMILSLVLTGICYVLMVTVTVGVIEPEALRRTLTPIADGAFTFMGRFGGIAMNIAASLAFLTTANAGILAGSRYLLALSRDGMLPQSVGNIGSRFHTPHVAILLTGCFVILPLFIDLHILVECASIGLIFTNIFSLLSVIILRESRLQNYRPIFHAPLYPWLQISGLTGFVLLLFEMRKEAFIINAMLAIAGFCLYWFYGRPHVQHQSALTYVLQRLTARKPLNGALEAELKEIVLQRDQIILDRFDKMVEECPVLDLKGLMSRDEFFSKVAEVMASYLGVPSEVLLHRLIAREEESSTVIGPHIAIPHVVIESNKSFGMLIARCKPGVCFGEDATEIHTVVVLAGSLHERNFHLRCLAAIAQVVQTEGFEEQWLAAPGEQALRDLFIFSRRARG